MTRELSEAERDYLLSRSADHDRLADASGDDSRRTLHRRFAALYRERADALEPVKDH